MNRDIQLPDAKPGAAFTVRVITRAERDEIAAVMEDKSLKIRLMAAPSESNPALIRFLAERLGVDESAVEIVAGESKPDKWVSVIGVSAVEAEQRLQADPDADE